MSASEREHLIIGHRARQLRTPQVETWTLPSQEELQNLPPVAEHAADVLEKSRTLLRESRAEQERAVATEAVDAAAEKFRSAVEKIARHPTQTPPSPPLPEGETSAEVPERPEEEAPAAAPESAVPSAARDEKEQPPDTDSVGRVKWLVSEKPEDAAKLLRTMLLEDNLSEGPRTETPGDGESRGDEMEMPTMQKIAILFVALGEESSGEVMKHLSDFEVEEVTQSIAALKTVPTEVMTAVLEEFEQHLLAGEWVSQGGIDFARSALERAVGPRKAQEILDRVATRVTSGFYMLKNVSPDQIAPFISHEHPQTIALILSQLDSAQAAGILAQLPERLQSNVGYRIATMENITPNVIKQIEESLEQSLRDILSGDQDVGGPKVVADILNMTGSSVEKNVLDQMDGQDAEVAEAVRNLMFVFEDISKLTDREIQVLLQEVDQKDLVVALKAASEELKDKILGNMSEKVRTFITEEMEFLGPMRLSEVEEVQLRIVQQVRQLEEQGKVTIIRGDSDDQFV